MTETYVINFYPLVKLLIISLAIIGAYVTINNFFNFIQRYNKDKLDIKKDIHAKNCDADIIQDLVQKYPLVNIEFAQKTFREQNVENNQEIHELNKRIKALEDKLKWLIT